MSAEYEAACEIRAAIDSLNNDLQVLLPERRERIATAAMQGLLSRLSKELDAGAIGIQENTAQLAVDMADALIAELDKEKA